MIGYNNLNHYDWSHYFEGGMCFRLNPNGIVRAYHLGELDVEEPEPEYDEDGEPIYPENNPDGAFVDKDHSAYLRAVASSNIELAGANHNVRLYDLFNDPMWVVHRFQLGYVPLGNKELAFIGMEPTASRMSKSLNIHNLYTHGILNDRDAGGKVHPVSSLQQLQRGLCLGRHLPSARWPEIWEGVCKVLSYGKSTVFHDPTRRDTVDMVRTMLSLELDNRAANVIVPDFTTAVIGHRSDPRSAYVVTNGAIVGTVRLDTERNVLVLSTSWTRYPDKAARKLAKKALEDKAKRLYADEVKWEAY